MSFDTYSFVEHFDFIKNCIPQPFFITCDSVNEICKNGDDEYIIKTSKCSYSLNRKSLKKLVDFLGVKVKLLSAVCNEVDVIDLAMPIINKLFKCFADCFVFYANQDDQFSIIDLNINNVKGDEGTKYENGPSPWKDTSDKSLFTCFANFMDRFNIGDSDMSILVKADDIMSSDSVVSLSLLKIISNSSLQPMMIFNSKFSNMSGFTEVYPALYDTISGITVTFPINYGKAEDQLTVNGIWNKTLHLYESVDFDEYIFREINELASSEDAPTSLKNFIASILTESELNINQPTKNLLSDCVEMMGNMKPSKKKKFSKMMGSLIGWCFVQKHSACSECGKIHIR